MIHRFLNRKLCFLFFLISMNFLSCFCLAETHAKELNLEQLYDAYSQDYEALIDQTHYQGPFWITKKKECLPCWACTILDLGCADGHIGRLCLSFHPHYQLTGVDFSKGMVQACEKKGGYQEVIQANLNEGIPICLLGKQYNLVLALGCLEFIDHHQDLFGQIYSLLPAGGQFWLTVQAKSENSKDHDVLIAYSEQELTTLLKHSGFRILDLEFQEAGYVRSFDKKNVPYFFVIAEVNTRIKPR